MTVRAGERELFDIPENMTYLNCASNGPQLRTASNAVIHAVNLKRHPWTREESDFYSLSGNIRTMSSQMFGGHKHNYAIHPSVSYGVATMFNILKPSLSNGDEVLVMKDEFPSNRPIWERYSRELNINIIDVEREEGESWEQAFIDQITNKTRVCLLSTCCWYNGELIPLEKLSSICRSKEIIFSVDATQSLGVMPIDLDRIRPDFLFAAGYKWLLSAYGFSLCYIDDKWLESDPLEDTWISRKSNNPSSQQSTDLACVGNKFDVGQTCSHNILSTVNESLIQIQSWGIENIAGELEVVNQNLKSILASEGMLTEDVPHVPHFFGVINPRVSSERLSRLLKADDIFTSSRNGYLRISPYLLVDKNDIDRFSEAVKRRIKKLQRK